MKKFIIAQIWIMIFFIMWFIDSGWFVNKGVLVSGIIAAFVGSTMSLLWKDDEFMESIATIVIFIGVYSMVISQLVR